LRHFRKGAPWSVSDGGGKLHVDAVQQQKAASIHTTRRLHKLVGRQRLDGLIILRIKRGAGGGPVRARE